MAAGTAVGGKGVDGWAVASEVTLSVGGRGEGVSRSVGCVASGGSVLAGKGKLGLGVITTREGRGDGIAVALGSVEDVGTDVFVARANMILVFVGTGMTASVPGRHWVVNETASPAHAKKNKIRGRFAMANPIPGDLDYT